MHRLHQTPQEEFWAGTFGDEYILRNRSPGLVAKNIMLFSKILARTAPITSAIEFGANIGLNLLAIRSILPSVELTAIEINHNAVEELRRNVEGVNIHHVSILDFTPETQWDLVVTKGVLIHISPKKLGLVYDLMHTASKKYICIAEYYNPTPVELTYRGHDGVLFKRDFAGELLDHFNDLRLVDYGFIYRRDNNYPLDDITWFLLEKERRN